MENIKAAFHVISESEEVPIGYKKINCHWVFDVKFDFNKESEICSWRSHV